MNFHDAVDKMNEVRCTALCRLLESHGFHAQYAKDRGAALAAALELIPDGASVGIPGSVTVREVGLEDALERRGVKVSTHWDPKLTKQGKRQRLLDELTSDWVVMSANAISEDEGTFVNIDGTGNRVGAMSWAPGRLLIIAGVNKIAPDLSSAVKRARDEASVPNAARMSADTPCQKTGRCMNCLSAQRICNITALLERAPIGRECHVIIVGENLGY